MKEVENLRAEEQQKTTQERQKKEENVAVVPGQLRVMKRNGSVVSYEAEKITIAIMIQYLFLKYV